MRFRKVGLQLNCAQRRGFGLTVRRSRSLDMVEGGEHVGVGQSGVWQSRARVDSARLREIVEASAQAVGCALVPVVAALQIKLERTVVDRAPREPLRVLRGQAALQRRGNILNDLGFDVHDIRAGALECRRPQLL